MSDKKKRVFGSVCVKCVQLNVLAELLRTEQVGVAIKSVNKPLG